NSVYTLIEAGGTMLDIEPLLTNQEFRAEAIKHVKNEAVHIFWHNRFVRWENKDRISNVESTLNKVSTFTSDPRIRMMLSSKKSTIDIRNIMDTGKVLLINLSKGALRTNSYLLGALFVAKIQMAAMSRESLPPQERIPWYLYVDEFQNYATDSFAEILSEARKYGLSITLAHQNLKQLPENLKATILSNAKNFIIFRLDRQDAELIAKYMFEYDPFWWKLKDGDKYTFYSMNEQEESLIYELTNLDAQFAYLKTKGNAPRMSRTYDLPDTGCFEENFTTLRQINLEQGYLRDVNEIAESLTFQPSSIYEPDEPEGFFE
ncbi:MAG: TraM recognition domain-containing protein, partial [Actinomycetota bacterium]|nr:TraM recognition domain-containing protein [Actinomycetota bacterium]